MEEVVVRGKGHGQQVGDKQTRRLQKIEGQWSLPLIFSQQQQPDKMLQPSISSSIIASTIQPIAIPLPLAPSDLQLSLPLIPTAEIHCTITGIMQLQSQFLPCSLFLIALFYITIEAVLVYLFLIVAIFSLLNVVLVGVGGGVLWWYGRWALQSLVRARRNRLRGRIQKFLEAENKRFYGRKLIRWNVAQGTVVINNLRLVF